MSAERPAAKVKQFLTSADSGKTTDPAQTTAAVANAAKRAQQQIEEWRNAPSSTASA